MFNCECGADLIQEDCETILDVCQEAPVVKDYETLANKPQINGVTLDGNKTSEDLGITQEIADAVSAEATLRENADTALGGRIDAEITNRGNADTALGGRIDGEITNRTNADNALGTRIDNEILARQGGDNNLQTQIDAITSKSDVVDVVADYASLQAYDTQHLGNNDVIKVLDDETHDNAQTYYRWNKLAGTWSYIGSEAPYYSKGQMDVFLQAKQDKLIAGTNIQIAQDGKTISATDTTYTAGNGLNLNGTEFSADTTVLATKSDLDSYYTKTETDNKLAPKLETEVVSTLPATGDEGKLYLTPKNYTTGTASGNPITISLGEDAGQITSAQLDGDTFQQTYTGKNLIDGIFRQGNKQDLTTTNRIFTTQNFPVESGVTYTLSTTLNTSTYKWAVNIATAPFPQPTENVPYDSGWRTSDTFSFTPSINGYLGVIVAHADGTTNLTPSDISGVKWQLEKSSSASSYEPYVGGVPAPNPNYPQQVQTVTGEQTVTVVGKNKYPFSDVLWSTTSTTTGWRFQNGDGNAYGATITDKTNYKLTLPAGTYTMTAFGLSPNVINIQACANGESAEKIVTSPASINSENLSSTITLTENTTFCVRYRVTNPSLGIGDTKIQIEKSETSTAYAPYKSTDYKINLSDNELEIPDGTLTNNGVKCIMDSNSATITRTSANSNTSFIRYELDTPITIHSGETFTLYAGNIDTIGNKTTTGSYMSVRLRKSNNTDDTNTDTLLGNFNAKTTITATEDVTYTHLVIRTSPSLYPDNLVIAPRLVIGQDNSIELCKIGEYQDYIYKDEGDWKIHKAIATITVDGSESWAYNGDNKFNAANISGMAMPINADALCYCATHIGVLSAGSGTEFTPLVADKPYAADVHKTATMVRIKDIRFTTTTELESWLSQNNTTIYYVVATATDTTITDTNLIAQLEAVLQAKLQASNTITNTATGTNLAGDLELGYYEYDPTNRYDKWLWLDLNNAYEKLGS